MDAQAGGGVAVGEGALHLGVGVHDLVDERLDALERLLGALDVDVAAGRVGVAVAGNLDVQRLGLFVDLADGLAAVAC